MSSALADHVSVGATHSCAILDDGTIKCWGGGGYGQLGVHVKDGEVLLFPSQTVNLGVNPETGKTFTAEQVTANYYHTCALLTGGFLKCWGYNQFGALGIDTKDNIVFDPSTLPTINFGINPNTQKPNKVVKVVSGFYHSCVLLDSNEVKCWGYNVYGVLGIAGSVQVLKPSQAVDFGLNPLTQKPWRILQLEAGAVHNCALLENNELRCWGDNSYGELGIGSEVPSSSTPKTPVSFGKNQETNKPYQIQKIACGGTGNCAVLDDSVVKCWGYNGYGLAGDPGEGTISYIPGSEIKLSGNSIKILNLRVGSYHACAMFEDGAVKCWGYNGEGELGLGDSQGRGLDPSKMGDALPSLDLEPGLSVSELAMSSMSYHSCVVFKETQTMKCWGYNAFGQLGNGDQMQRGSKPNEMGVNLPFVNLGPLAKVMK